MNKIEYRKKSDGSFEECFVLSKEQLADKKDKLQKSLDALNGVRSLSKEGALLVFQLVQRQSEVMNRDGVTWENIIDSLSSPLAENIKNIDKAIDSARKKK